MMRTDPVTVLKGIGEKTAGTFARAGIVTLDDLIHYFPSRYESFSPPEDIDQTADGHVAAVRGFFQDPLKLISAGGSKLVTGMLTADSGRKVSVSWFHMPYLRSQIRPGTTYILRGHVKRTGKRIFLTQPSVYSPEEYAALQAQLQPVYALCSGLTANMLRKAIRQACGELPSLAGEYLPEELRSRYHLCLLAKALQKIHFPENEDALAKAHRRLAFDEFFLFILTLRFLRQSRELITHNWVLQESTWAKRVIDELPFRLTNAQQKVWAQIREDLGRRAVMARLIQGDVGSGKTIIAFLALIMNAENGRQGALMAPTEVLARQHFASYEHLRREHQLPFRAVLLTGSLTAAEKRAAREEILEGRASVIIGTHALIQESVSYDSLSLVITDEQHRFGVRQRDSLSQKGELPHVLVMSATPIPRTLAIILYGDLDVSVMDEMPKNRIPIKNAAVGPAWRPNAWRFIEKETAAGHQAYVICPLTEASELMEGENVEDYARLLQKAFHGNVRVEYLHGRMSVADKNDRMERFVRGEIQVLVSTTVVEVGVDVPNATVIMIENADRFGLSQLHQLRGRVGRGSVQSYCILVNSQDQDPMPKRLEVLCKTNDGFAVAREDLKLRGPGDILGVRQNGALSFRLADVFSDADLLTLAGEAADCLLKDDPGLELSDHQLLKRKLEEGGTWQKCLKP